MRRTISSSYVPKSTDVSITSLLTASANVCNVALMRHNELSEGIDVLDANGNVVGSSRIAAKHVSDAVEIPVYGRKWNLKPYYLLTVLHHIQLYRGKYTITKN